MQKLLDQCSQNSLERWHMGQGKNSYNYILMVIRIWIQIQELFKGILPLWYWQSVPD